MFNLFLDKLLCVLFHYYRDNILVVNSTLFIGYYNLTLIVLKYTLINNN